MQNSISISYPDGRTIGYLKAMSSGRYFNAESVSQEFLRPYGNDFFVVLDGWSQTELAQTSVGWSFGFHLLASSEQYLIKSQGLRRLVLLPAWKDVDLKSLWTQQEFISRSSSTFEEKLYYSGGSARDMCLPIEDVKYKIAAAVAGMTEESCKGLLSIYVGGVGLGFDRLRRSYVSDTNNIEAYLTIAEWTYVVDSAYALNLLGMISMIFGFFNSQSS
jgi:hypothetical protein